MPVLLRHADRRGQHHHSTAAYSAQKGCFRIGIGWMATNGVVKPPCNQQALFVLRTPTKRSAQQSGDLGEAWPQVIGRTSRPEYCRARRAFEHVRFLHEMLCGIDPTRLRDNARPQKH